MSTWKTAGKVRMTPKGAWNAQTNYEVLDLVSDDDRTVFYIAKQDVPAGTVLTNTDYWVVVVDTTNGYRVRAAEIIAEYVKNYGARQAFNIFIKMLLAINPETTLNEAVTMFYENAKTGKIYGSEFYCFNVSNVSTGTKTDANAGLTCVPSTNDTAGRDDYADLALFMPININYDWSDTTDLEPTITEIQGITDGFSFDNPNGLVGVLQMGAWLYVSNDGNKKYRKYSDTQINADYKPLPECVRFKDNSFRPWMIHAKYVAGLNAAEKLTSAAGLPPTTYATGCRFTKSISHDGQIALWRELGAAYSGTSMCDRTFLELMFEIKYARLGNSGLIEGCTSYNSSKQVALGETDVKRVLLSAADGAYFLVGSTISIGSENDRSKANGHSVVDHYRITKKENVTIEGTSYIAMTIDAPAVFTTTAGDYVIPEPWYSGSCGNVQGNDGSPYSLTDGKNPGMIQGIEFMVGVYEVLADTVLRNTGNATYEVMLNRKAGNLATGGAGTDSYTLTEIITIEGAAGWKYNKELGNSVEGFMVPTEIGGTASSSNGYRSATYTEVDTSAAGYREWPASGTLHNGGTAGVPDVYCNSGLTLANWNVAARASGSGGNRGEFGAA